MEKDSRKFTFLGFPGAEKMWMMDGHGKESRQRLHTNHSGGMVSLTTDVPE